MREKSVKMGENGFFLRGYEDFGVLWEILGACEGIWSSVGISKIWGALKGCEDLSEGLS